MAGSWDLITRNCFEILLFFPSTVFIYSHFLRLFFLPNPQLTETPHVSSSSIFFLFPFFFKSSNQHSKKIKWYKNRTLFHMGMFSSSSSLVHNTEGFCFINDMMCIDLSPNSLFCVVISHQVCSRISWIFVS